MVDLSSGDFLYQSDQELFLVLIDETDDSYRFAVHGWRDIDKDRIEEYIEDSRSKIHKQAEIEDVVDDEGDEEAQKQFNKLKQLFAVYEDADIPEDGPQSSEFTLKDK